jgi:hypothetical protein
VVTALKYMTQIINNKYVGKSPKAHLYYEAGFVGGIAIGQVNTSLRPGITINHFPWPTINPKWGNRRGPTRRVQGQPGNPEVPAVRHLGGRRQDLGLDRRDPLVEQARPR